MSPVLFFPGNVTQINKTGPQHYFIHAKVNRRSILHVPVSCTLTYTAYNLLVLAVKVNSYLFCYVSEKYLTIIETVDWLLQSVLETSEKLLNFINIARQRVRHTWEVN